MTPQKIKQLRQSMNLSQQAFAKGLKISVRLLQEWEQGRFTPNPAAISLLSHLAECKKMQRQVAKLGKS